MAEDGEEEEEESQEEADRWIDGCNWEDST